MSLKGIGPVVGNVLLVQWGGLLGFSFYVISTWLWIISFLFKKALSLVIFRYVSHWYITISSVNAYKLLILNGQCDTFMFLCASHLKNYLIKPCFINCLRLLPSECIWKPFCIIAYVLLSWEDQINLLIVLFILTDYSVKGGVEWKLMLAAIHPFIQQMVTECLM